LQPVDSIAALEALARLLVIAQRDTGQSHRVANFLLAWHNTDENGGWNPVDLWQLDDVICADLMLVLRLIAQEHRYPDDLGFGLEITKVWERWPQPTG
jgi:hypothetical protein